MDAGQDGAARELQGEVRLPRGAGRFAVVTVSLRRVDKVDGPAFTVAATELRDVDGDAGSVPFVLALPPEVSTTGLAWRAHADRLGTGRVDVGDFVTTTTVPLTDPVAPVVLELTGV